MDASINEIQTITDYKYLGKGDFYPSITLDDYVILLLQEGPLTRDEMSRMSGIPRTTLYDTLKKLWLKGEVKNFKKKNRRGRSTIHYILRKHVYYFERNTPYYFY